MAKATITIRQTLQYQPHQASWFAATAALFNRIAAFYFEVIQAHEKVLELSSKEALTALEKLTHRTRANQHPVMPLSEIAQEVPAMFRRAAIHAALGSAHSFSTHLKHWRAHKAKAEAKGKTFSERPPVPPRSWNKSSCHALRGHVEGSYGVQLGYQGVDGDVLELAESPLHRERPSRRGSHGQSLARPAWRPLVAAYAGREAVRHSAENRTASHRESLKRSSVLST